MDIQHFIQQRETLGLSQAELARQAGVDRSIICRVESGKLRPSPSFLAACCKVLQISSIPGPATPRRRAISGLRSQREWLRRAFPAPQPPQVPPLRTAFALARHLRLGARLVERLDLQKRSGAEWTAIKAMAVIMNTPEQMFFLHALMEQALPHEIVVHEIGFPFSTVLAPGHWQLCFIVDSTIYVPQLTLALKSYTPRLDFLVALPGKPPHFIDLEIDGPGHATRREKDRQRALAIGLPELRIPHWRLEQEDFWEWYKKQLCTRRLCTATSNGVKS